MPKIGDALRAARSGATQEQIAAKMPGRDQPTISKWEGGGALPTIDDIAAFELAADRPRGFCLIAAGYVEVPTTTRQAIEMDADLDDTSRRMLLGLYDTAVSHSAADRSTKPPKSRKAPRS